jgi:arylsulfatase A-like enzyme
MYPLDGDRMVPGTDPAHLGGDTWVADVAIAIAEHEPWSGLFVSFGGIDKAAHMWGGINDTTANDPTHLKAVARNADEQLGRLLKKLEDLGQLAETLIVITADHGGNTAVSFHGTNAAGRADYNWYYGKDADESYEKPQPQIQPLLDTGNIAFSYQDSAIRTWLVDRSLEKKKAAALVMRGLPSVIATFYLDGDRYALDSDRTPTAMTPAERAWFSEHGQEIVDTMAAPYAPDVVGLLSDDTSYGVKGDHGGAQKPVQRIPMIISGPGIAKGQTPSDAFRCVDITPTVLRLIGAPAPPPGALDGKAIPVPAP